MTAPELTDLQLQVVTTMAAAQAAGMHPGPADLAEALAVSEGDVLRALADLVDAGVIRQTADAGEPDPVAHDPARLPHSRRAVLVALMIVLEATPADLANAVPGGGRGAAVAIEALTAMGMVTSCGPSTVTHTDLGWETALAEIEAGPAAGDPLPMKITYAMLAKLRARAEAAGSTLSDLLAAEMTHP